MLGACIGGLGAFALLAIDDALHGPVFQSDTRVNDAVTAWEGRGFPAHDLGEFLTLFGEGETVAAVVIVAAGYTLAHRQWVLAGWVVTIGIANSLFVTILKELFQRARPPIFGDLRHTYSFPSGHTFAATAVLGAALIVAAEVYRRARIQARRTGHGTDLPPDTSPRVQRPESTRLLWITTLAGWALLAIGTGFGRVLVQEHWLSDVMASWALGLSLCCGLMLALSTWHPDGEEGPRAPPKKEDASKGAASASEGKPPVEQ